MRSIAETAGAVVQVDKQAASTTVTPPGLITESHCEIPKAAQEYINRVFQRLTVITPAWKASVDGDVTEWAGRYKAELSAALKAEKVSTGEEIQNGLSELRKTGNPYLPAPGEFAKFCKGSAGNWEHKGAAYRVFRKDRLLEQIVPPEVKQDAMQKIREAIAG